jgi:hypothetical protein
MKEFRKTVLLGVAILLMVVGIYLPPPAMAMTPLSDEEMVGVIGQGGISLTVDHFTADTQIKTLFYGDSDGLGEGSRGGYISLTDVVFKGSVAWDPPLQVDMVTAGDGRGNAQMTGMRLSMSNAMVNIDRFTIDAIRLGSEPGVGNSLGSFGIYNLSARITGSIAIVAH